MNRRFILLIIILVSTKIYVSVPLLSQEKQIPKENIARIRVLAFDGKLDTAAADARKLVNNYPSYGDARILLGRILAWQKNYADAAAVIDTLLMTEPSNADALSAKRDILTWSKENTTGLNSFKGRILFDTFR